MTPRAYSSLAGLSCLCSMADAVVQGHCVQTSALYAGLQPASLLHTVAWM